MIQNIEDIQKILNKEIRWCRKNRGIFLEGDYEDGFIEGLKQAKLLIKKFHASSN